MHWHELRTLRELRPALAGCRVHLDDKRTLSRTVHLLVTWSSRRSSDESVSSPADESVSPEESDVTTALVYSDEDTLFRLPIRALSRCPSRCDPGSLRRGGRNVWTGAARAIAPGGEKISAIRHRSAHIHARNSRTDVTRAIVRRMYALCTCTRVRI